MKKKKTIKKVIIIITHLKKKNIKYKQMKKNYVHTYIHYNNYNNIVIIAICEHMCVHLHSNINVADIIAQIQNNRNS